MRTHRLLETLSAAGLLALAAPAPDAGPSGECAAREFT
jgi:hypothetical protein